jgi:hypothetical protein
MDREELVVYLYRAGFNEVQIPEGTLPKISVSLPHKEPTDRGAHFFNVYIQALIPKDSEARSYLIRAMLQSKDMSTLREAHRIMQREGVPPELFEEVVGACVKHLDTEETDLLKLVDEAIRNLISVVQFVMKDKPSDVIPKAKEKWPTLVFQYLMSDKFRDEVNCLLRSPLKEARRLGVHLLFVLDKKPSMSVLKTLAHDPDENVRTRLAALLGQLKDEPRKELRSPLLADPSSEVKVAAISALKSVGSPIPFDELEPLFRDPDKEVRQTTLKFLRDSYGPSELSLKAYRIFMHDPLSEIREEAVSGFESCFSRNEASPWINDIVDIINDPPEEIARAAAGVFVWLCDEKHLDTLINKYEENPTTELKWVIWVCAGDHESLEREARGRSPLWSRRKRFPAMINRAKKLHAIQGPVKISPSVGATFPSGLRRGDRPDIQKVIYFKDHLFDRKLAVIDEIVEAVLAGNEHNLPMSLDEIDALMNELAIDGLIPDWHGNWEALGRYIPDSYVSEYDDEDRSYLLAGHVDDKRLQELEEGAAPTKDEVVQWKKAWTEDALESGSEVGHGVQIKEIADSLGRSIFALIESSGGGWDYDEAIEGLFARCEDAEKYLRQDATLQWIDEPKMED